MPCKKCTAYPEVVGCEGFAKTKPLSYAHVSMQIVSSHEIYGGVCVCSAFGRLHHHAP
jgi:hypothetical protein